MQILFILRRRHSIHPTGRVLVQVPPAVPQQLGVQAPVEVLKPVLLVGCRLDGYPPQEGWLVFIRPACVRHEGPMRATSFRPVLPPVPDFLMLRVLCLIRLPDGIRRAFPLTVLLRLPASVFSLPA